ncbi:MAG: IS66 family transposase [Bacteroidales bacterium]|nr:IS66 family transposase [Bacteroidales bacterium]
MSIEQLRTLVQEQQKENLVLRSTNQNLAKEKDQLKQKNEVHIAKVITSYENKVRVIEEEKDHLEKEKESLLKKIQDILEKFSSVKFELSQMKRLIFGSKRERFVSGGEDGQMSLPFEVEALPKETEPSTEEIAFTRRKTNRKNHHGRLPLPDHLPVEEILIEPEEDVTGLKCIGYEITDELEYDAAILKIKRYKRPKYAKENNEGVITGNLPTRPIEKCIAGAGLLAHIQVSKFVYHMPFYRQAQRFKTEHQMVIPSSTIDSWQTGVAKLMWPLYEELKRQVLSQGYIQLDETPIKVLDQRKKGKCHRGWHWVYNSPIEHMVFFDYQQGRGREGPRTLLTDFKGYLQTDGYKVYDWFGVQKDITLVNCWAHARRFFEKSLSDDRKQAEHAMKEIQKLYHIERKARDQKLSPEQRHELRLDESLPILNALGTWMAEQIRTTLPKSPFGKALIYSISRWDNLMAYLKDGHLEIDNNLVENSIRPNALGRRNHLFAGSHAGAQKAAMFYSFFGTCKFNDVDPFKWMKTVLEIMPDHPANKLVDLLPQNLDLQRYS